MRNALVPIIAILLGTSLTAAEPRYDAAAANRAIGPFLDEQVFGVVQLDLARIAPADLRKLVAELKLDENARGRADRALAPFAQAHAALTKAGATQVFVIASLADIPNEPPFVVIPLPQEADAKALRSALAGKLPVEVQELHHSLVLAGSKTLQRLRDLKKPATLPLLSAGLQAANDSPIRLAFFVPPSVRRSAEEIMPTLPKHLGGGSITLLTREFEWLAVDIELAPKAAVRIEFKTRSEKAAKELSSLLATAVKQVAAESAVPLDSLLKVEQPTIKDGRLLYDVDRAALVAIIGPLSTRYRLTAERDMAMNRVKQIGLGMFGYSRLHKVFPPQALLGKDKKPLLSWRVLILPYLDQQELYAQFHLDEPWDSEHNRKLISKMPAVFHGFNRKLSEEGKTPWVVPVGKDTAFPAGGAGIRPDQIRVGGSNIAMLVEADDEHSVIWTRPEDLNLDPEKPVKGLADHKEWHGCIMVRGDGSVFVCELKPLDRKKLMRYFDTTGRSWDK